MVGGAYHILTSQANSSRVISGGGSQWWNINFYTQLIHLAPRARVHFDHKCLACLCVYVSATAGVVGSRGHPLITIVHAIRFD